MSITKRKVGNTDRVRWEKVVMEKQKGIYIILSDVGMENVIHIQNVGLENGKNIPIKKCT